MERFVYQTPVKAPMSSMPHDLNLVATQGRLQRTCSVATNYSTCVHMCIVAQELMPMRQPCQHHVTGVIPIYTIKIKVRFFNF